MAAIPKAQDFIRSQDQKHQTQKSAFLKAQAAQERFDKAANEMVTALTRSICAAITKVEASGSATRRVEFRTSSLGFYQGLPGDVLLYGHRTDNWQARTDLGLDVTTFERLQAAFLAADWYLIEETDPAKSRAFVFAVYAQKPESTHPYFNRQGKLWHHHNLFDEEKLSDLVVPAPVQEPVPETGSDVPEDSEAEDD